MTNRIPSISVNYACNGRSIKSNEMGMREMQERAYAKRGEQYLLIKSPPASGNNPNRLDETDTRTPEEIIAEIEKLDAQSAKALPKIKELL